MRMRLIALGIALIAALVVIGPAGAEQQDESSYQKAFETWNQDLAALEGEDSLGSAKQTIASIRTLVGQGQAYLASEKLDAIEPLLERARALSALAGFQIERAKGEAEAAEAEATAEKAEQEAKAATDATDAVQKRYDELEKQGL